MILQKNPKKSKKIVKSAKKKNIKRIIFWSCMIALLVGLYELWIFVQSPSSGQIHAPKAIKEQNLIDSPVIYGLFDGNFFSFHYPQKYVMKDRSKDSPIAGRVLESAFFSQAEINSRKIAVTVEKMDSANMEDSSGYNFREKNPKVYALEKNVLGDMGGVIFKSSSDNLYEKAFFIPRKGYLAIIVFSTPVPAEDDFQIETDDIIKSIQWKR